MKIETQPLEGHQVKLVVEVEPESLEAAKRRAARQFAKRTKIPGFRPGKAPYQVVLRQVGEANILEEALDLLVQDIYPQVIDEAGIQPYGPGKLENVPSVDPPVLEFVVPLDSEVTLGNYQEVRQPYEQPQVTEEQVNEVVENLRDHQAVLEPVERPAQEGDMVYVRLSARRTQVEEGENPALIQERTLPLVIQAEGEQEEDPDSPKEWPFPGFSRRLVGLSAGDEQTFTHTFAEDSDFESLRGVEAEFHFTVEDVKSRTLPELNDEFAKSVGEYADFEALRAEIRSGLERQAQDAYNQDYDEKVLDEVVSGSTIKYPPQMLEREIDTVIDSLKHRLEHQNLDLDTYLKTRGIDMEALRQEAQPVAESRLKKSLTLMELAKAENIQVEQEELQEETVRTIDELSRSMSEKEARRLTDRNVFSNVVGSVMLDMMTRRALERMREISSGKVEAEQPVSETEAESPQPEAVEEAGSAPENELSADEAASATPSNEAAPASASPEEDEQVSGEESLEPQGTNKDAE